MKNFIFALCGFLMMSLVSLSVQASSVESSKCEYVTPSVDASLSDIQFVAFETVPADCIVQATPQTLFLLANAPAMVCMIKKEAAVRWKRIDVLNVRFDISINRSIARITLIPHTAN